MGSLPRTSWPMGVYAITHRASGRCYIGSSTNLPLRWRQHRKKLLRGRHHNQHLQCAWNKYGAEAFRFAVLDYVDAAEDLIATEQAWLNCVAPAYNIRPLARSNLGLKFSAESRQRVSASIRGRRHSAETRAKMSASAKGQVRSEATRRKISALHKGKVLTPEHRAKISAGGKGRVVSRHNLEKRRATRAAPGYAEQFSINLRRAWSVFRNPTALAAKAGWPADVEAISIKEAAALLGCATSTIRLRIHDGSLPATPVGKFWIIRRTDLDAVAPSLCARFDRYPERQTRPRLIECEPFRGPAMPDVAREIRRRWAEGEASQAEMARAYNVSRSTIGRIVAGVTVRSPEAQYDSATRTDVGEWLGVTKAASLLGVSRARLLRLIAQGRLPARRSGRQFRIRPDDLEALRADRAMRPWGYRSQPS